MTEPARPATISAGRPEPLASRLRTTLLRTSRRLRDQRVGDLSDAQLAVLGQLVGHGALTPSELADREHVRPPSMTKTIQHLLEAGLIERRAHPDDGRQVLIEASTQGREHILATRRRRDEWLKKRLAALTREERATLSAAEELLRRIYSQ
ncbi:MarR family winged helix-turn-helix transcriptional regulator [Pseudactinotalea suaedae]|jgi:DNA-binding MarR family transcriptional regulator|uniref:MarR family winged helix-turn-helix transcriptional regulator n=1 Tax=Pseudactinotalea suaedae TaxID=1524924 RepID=UPI0012E12A70|nr:MarR family transcriptional regulator [Pseudactinotalea suaedae]